MLFFLGLHFQIQVKICSKEQEEWEAQLPILEAIKWEEDLEEECQEECQEEYQEECQEEYQEEHRMLEDFQMHQQEE
jgi:hypothetical protein